MPQRRTAPVPTVGILCRPFVAVCNVADLFQSGMVPSKGDEPTGAPTEPEATSRRTSMEPPVGTDAAMTGSTEGQPEADSLSAAGDQGADATETADKGKESAKYIEKRGCVIFAVIEIRN